MGVASGIDRTQRRVPVIGVPLAVIYKYFDDQGNYLAAVLTFYAFFAIFPLLLLASSILGFVLQGYPELQKGCWTRHSRSSRSSATRSADQAGCRVRPAPSSSVRLGALYGAVGLGLALQNVQAAAWAVPRNSRPHPVLTRVTACSCWPLRAAVILAVSVLSAVVTETELVGTIKDPPGGSSGWYGWSPSSSSAR